MLRLIAVAGFSLLFQAVAWADPPATPGMTNGHDPMLHTESGKTLYVYDPDKAGTGKSVCVKSCAQTWPPFLAGADAQPTGDFTLINRDDTGRKQWAYKGRPLYTFYRDERLGQALGKSFQGNLWHIAHP